MSNSSNKDVNLQEKIEMKIQRAEELANKKRRFSRELFTTGDKVSIQT